MKLRVFLAAFVAIAFTGLQAQTETNWFIQGQLGASYAPSDATFKQSVSPAAQISVGKFFTPTLGARLSFAGWMGRSSEGEHHNVNKFNYWSATVDGLLNLHSAFWGAKENRRFNTNFILGIGYNDGVGNHQKPISSFMVKTGFNFNYRLNKALDVVAEINANGVHDRWNKLDDHKFDTYINALVGLTYRIGSGHKCNNCKPVVIYNDEIEPEVKTVVETVHDTVVVEKIVTPEPEIESLPSAAVFFSRAKSDISAEEDAVIRQLIKDVNGRPVYYMVVGYADKGTGNPTINQKYAKDRAERVATALNEKYGVAKDDIKVDSKGDTVQPYAENDKNRVAIITVEKK